RGDQGQSAWLRHCIPLRRRRIRRHPARHRRPGGATRGRADLRQGGGVRSPDQGHGERRPGRPLPRREGFSRSAAHCGGRSGAVPGEGPRGQLCGRGGIAVSRLSVIALSQAFQGFWNDLALDLGTTIDLVGPAEAVTSSPETAALIVGETGTGKELLARAIHEGGPRRGAPFVAVNYSAFPEHLIESELFGHERGSFTDAHAAKPGLFEVADRGTLFLDEIGDLPLSLQAKLLRVLEDKQIRRVGGTKSRTVDVRILAATNEHLAQRVREGRFRDDLYFRLSSVVLRLPPLRERGDDLSRVAQALLERLAREHGLPVPTLTPAVYRQLRAHPWPGNIRELKNALERGLLLSPAGELSADELLPSEPPGQADGPIPFPAPLHQITTA